MKKKILSVILCVVMLAATLAVTVGAYTPIASLDSVSDKTCAKIITATAKTASTFIRVSGSNITSDTTMTLYFKLDESTKDIQNGFPITLVNSYVHNQEVSATQIFASIACDVGTKYSSCGSGYFMIDGTTHVYNTKDTFDAEKAPSVYMNVGEWNRVDMVIDFTMENDVTTAKVTGYINYKLVGEVNATNAESGYSMLCFPFIRNANKNAYLDNIVVRSGLNAPAKGDIASNMNLTALKADASVIHFNSFDTAAASFAAGIEGNFWNGASLMSIYNEDGIGLQNGAMNRGYQQSVAVADTQDANKKIYNTRFVATLDDYTQYDEIGFKLTVNGKETYVPCNKVYDSVTGGFSITETYSALGTYGAGYIYCLTVTGMEEGTSYAIEVAPYTVAKGETQKTVAASYTVTLTAGATAQ